MIKFFDDELDNDPISGKTLDDFAGKKGIIVYTKCNFESACGHVDLFDGNKVLGTDYSYRAGYMCLYELK